MLQTSSSITTSEQLAAVISNPRIQKYCQYAEEERIEWLGLQINALSYMTHSSRISNEVDLLVDSMLLNQMIIADEGMRVLTFVEIQEAFRLGILKEYGEYYGLSPASLAGFLKGFIRSPKRQKALAIVFKQEQQRLEAEIIRERRMLYEPKVKDFKRQFWRSTKGTQEIAAEESSAHKKKIIEQREKIMREYKK